MAETALAILHANSTRTTVFSTSTPRQRPGNKHRAAVSKPRKNVREIPGYHCFSLNGDPVNPRRSAFSAARKQEVKRVREQGACLRCKLRKIACSGGNPCKTCLEVANAAEGTRVLQWMECVRTTLDDGNFYRTDVERFRQLSEFQAFDRFAHREYWFRDVLPAQLVVQWTSTLKGVSVADKNLLCYVISVCSMNGPVRDDVGVEEKELIHYRSMEGVLTALDGLLKPLKLRGSPDYMFYLLIAVHMIKYIVMIGPLKNVGETSKRPSHIEAQREVLIRLLEHYISYLISIMTPVAASVDELLERLNLERTNTERIELRGIDALSRGWVSQYLRMLHYFYEHGLRLKRMSAPQDAATNTVTASSSAESRFMTPALHSSVSVIHTDLNAGLSEQPGLGELPNNSGLRSQKPHCAGFMMTPDTNTTGAGAVSNSYWLQELPCNGFVGAADVGTMEAGVAWNPHMPKPTSVEYQQTFLAPKVHEVIAESIEGTLFHEDVRNGLPGDITWAPHIDDNMQGGLDGVGPLLLDARGITESSLEKNITMGNLLDNIRKAFWVE